MSKKPYIFLDRDGTINVEKDYLHRVEEFEFEQGCIDGLKLLSQKGYGLVVITNQSGVGRGMYSLDDVKLVHDYMYQELRKENINIERIYICPHAPEEQCDCRKPKPTLYYQAIKELNIDVSHSYLVGDRVRDIQAASELGCDYAIVMTGHAAEENLTGIPSNHIFRNIREFAKSV